MRSVGDGKLGTKADQLGFESPRGSASRKLTLFHAVFLWSLVIRVFVHGCHSLDTFIVVVLVGGALGGFGAFCACHVGSAGGKPSIDIDWQSRRISCANISWLGA